MSKIIKIEFHKLLFIPFVENFQSVIRDGKRTEQQHILH